MVVLGGGLAGLAASMASGAPVYEASDQVGGVARSRNIDGFTFDYGIHVLQTTHATVLGMLADAGVRLCTRQRNAHIFSHNTYTAYPFQVNTAGLPLRLRANCVWKYLTRHRKGNTENYDQWIRQNVGDGFAETFLIPYSEKFWTVPPAEMTSEWTGNRIPSSNIWQVFRGSIVNRQTKVGTNSVFQYPEDGKGFGSIPEAFGRRVPNVFLNHRATRIDALRRCIQFGDREETVEYDRLISTLPLPVLVNLIADVPDHVCQAASRLRHNSILVVNLGFAQPDLSDKHWVHFPEKDVSFFRISYPHNLGPKLVPEGMSSVAAEVAYSDRSPVDKSTIVQRVIDDLIRVRAIPGAEKIVCRDLIDIRYGYVIYDHERKNAVRVIHEWLKSVEIYPTGRYGLWAYLWSHEAILAGLQTGKKLAGGVPERVREDASA